MPLCVEPLGKPILQGVYVGQHLSFGVIGKAYRGKPESTTGHGKSGRPEWNGGLAETWVTVELGTRRTIERVRVGNSLPNAACAVFLSQVLL